MSPEIMGFQVDPNRLSRFIHNFLISVRKETISSGDREFKSLSPNRVVNFERTDR
jgi:hypothetical protein